MSVSKIDPIWDDISVGFDSSEETINFGTRAFAQSDTDIYEANTVATIKSTKESLLCEKPKFHALFSPIGIGVSVDNSWTLFDSVFTEINHKISFKTNVETFEITEDGDFLFIALDNGVVECYASKLNWILVFSEELEYPSHFKGKCFFSRIASLKTCDGYEVYLIVNSGKVIRINGINFSLLSKLPSEDKQEESILNNLPIKVGFEYVVSVDGSFDMLAACLTKDSFENHQIWLCGSQLHIWENTNNSTSKLETYTSFIDDLSVTKIEASHTGDKIIGLTVEGSLTFFCPLTYLKVGSWSNAKVLNFSFVTQSMDNINPTSQLLMLTHSGVTELCLYDIKGYNLKVIFCLELDSVSSYLVHEQFNNEDVLFVEGFMDDSKVNALRIKAISITDAELRLDRLLKRGKFKEAKEFAPTFSLDIEIIHKARIRWLMNRLHQWYNYDDNTLNSDFDELLTLLQEIKDLEFVAECCLKTVAPKLSKVQKLLQYGIDKITKASSKSEHLQRLLDNLGITLRSLGTFMLLHPGKSATPDKWFIFSSTNPISLCKQHLSIGEIKEAIVICCRHSRKIRSELAESMAVTLLEILPVNVSVSDTLSWYECYIRLLLIVHPQCLPLLTRGIIDKAKLLEFTEREQWPEISVLFLSETINLLEKLFSLDDSPSGGVTLHQGKCLPDSPLNQLHFMHSKLQKLRILKNKHAIVMSYDIFSNYYGAEDLVDFVQLTSLLFEYVPMKGIPSLIYDFVEPYCIEHHKDIDYVIFDYVKGMVKKFARCWDEQSSLWELRCIAFADCIRNISEKMKVYEVIVRNAKIPWISKVHEIVQKSTRIKHPIAQILTQYSNKVSKKIILNKYDVSLEWVDAPVMNVLLLHIFRRGSKDVLKDALELIGSENVINVYESYFHHCVQLNNLEEIISLFRTVNPSHVAELCDNIIYSSSMHLQNGYNTCVESYLEVLPAVVCLLSKNCRDKADNRVKFMLASLVIKKMYGINVDFSELYSPKSRESVFGNCLIKLTEEQSESVSVEELTKKSRFLTDLLDMPRDLDLLELATISFHLSEISLTCQFLKALTESALSELNTLFVTHNDRLRILISAMMDVIASSSDVSTEDIDIICDAADLLVLECSSTNLTLNMDLINACQIFRVLPPKPSWCSLYDPCQSFRTPLSPAVSETLKQCIISSSNFEHNPILQEEVERTMQEAPKDLVSLNRMANLTAILSKHGVMDTRTLKKIKNITIQTVSAVLLKVIKSRKLDMVLAQSLLQYFQPDHAVKWLINVSNISLEVRQSRSLGLVGNQYCAMFDNLPSNAGDPKFCSFKVLFSSIHINAKWAVKLQQYGLSGQEAYKEDVQSRMNVIQRLMNVPSADCSLLREYCTDMNLDMEECLLLYLRLKLLSWKPRFKTITDPVTGRTEPVFEKDELFATCYLIAMQITNQELLGKFLNAEVWDKVNPYHYEVFLVILDILSYLPSFKNSTKKIENHSILLFLKSYIRISPCQESESDKWYSMFPSSTSLPAIAQYRLPFAGLNYVDINENLKPELSLETYEQWIRAPIWFQTAPDINTICLFTIYNLKDEEVSRMDGWYLHERKRDLLNNITKCIDYFTNLELAIAAWYFVVNHVMPPGVDQLFAAQKCILIAEEWKKQGLSELSTTNIYTKAEKKYYTVSTVHILYKYRLAKQEYLSLVSQPDELIFQLYQDPCITDSYTTTTDNIPNINEAVERIASLHSVNLTTIVLELLTEWLQPDNSLQATFTESMLLPPAVTSNETKTDNIYRACYVLLGHKELRDAENFLIGLAFPRNKDDTSKPIGVRLRALQVLTAITTSEHLEEVTSMDKHSIGNYMTILGLVYELDRHGLAYSISTFESAEKITVIKNLLNRSNMSEIKLAARIALTFDINERNIWNSIIRKMTLYAMVPELESVLMEVDYLKVERDIFRNAWNCVVLSTLARGERVNAEEKNDIIEKSFKLITSCPILTSLDVTSIANYFRKFNRENYAEMIENIPRDHYLENGAA